jgi:hypothetical protein
MLKKIPDFRSLEEAAEYWGTHSFAEHLWILERINQEASN